MLELNFGPKNTDSFNKDALVEYFLQHKEKLLHFNSNSNLFGELHEGSRSFNLDINGKRVLDWGSGVAGWDTIRNLNNASYDVLKRGEGVLRVVDGPFSDNYGCTIIIMRKKIKELDKAIFFTGVFNRDIFKSKLNGEICDLEQAMVEIIKLVNLYKSIWLEVVEQITSNKKENDEALKLIFEPIKQFSNSDSLSHDLRDNYNIWLPLEKAWKEYKSIK